MSLPLLTALAVAGPAGAQDSIPPGTVREGSLSFDGHASVGDFVGKTTSVTGEMSGGDIADVHGWVEAPVQTLVTGNSKRDRDLNKSMESDQFPMIRYELSGVTVGERLEDSMAVTLRGQFLIHGVTQSADLPATIWVLPGAVRVRSDVPLNLNDYKIRGLSKLLGILKMHPGIEVHVDVTFGTGEG